MLSLAHRGEAVGNHAEFIALEKKLSDAAVAGATVADSSGVSYYTHAGLSSYSVSVKPVNVSAPARNIIDDKVGSVIASWHPDKRHALVVGGEIAKGTYDCKILDVVTGQMSPYLLGDIGITEWFRFSPDGQWVAFEDAKDGMSQVHVASYPTPSIQYSLPVTPGFDPKWRGDGRELFLLGPGDTLYAVPVAAANGGLTFGTAQALFHPPIFPFPWNHGSFDVATDGSRFLINSVSAEGPSELVLATNWRR